MLTRSWRFRILAAICFVVAILYLVGLSLMLYFVSAENYLGPFLTATNTTLIALTVMTQLLTFFVVFFANDVGTRDKQVGIVDVISSRPVPTPDYVVGRILGILLPLVCLMGTVLGLSLVLNRLFGFHATSLRAVGKYFIFVCVVAVAFLLSLTAFLSSLLRSRALAALAAIAFILVVTVWLASRYDVFDIGGYGEAMSYSALIGYGPWRQLALHRLLYGCFTILLVAGTVFFYPRPETARRRKGLITALAVLLVASTSLAVYYPLDLKSSNDVREAWRDELTSAIPNTSAAVDRYEMDIKVIPSRRRLEGKVKTQLRNRSTEEQGKFVFTLNPGLDIGGVSTTDGTAVAVARKGMVVEIELATPLAPGDQVWLEWTYGGNTDQRSSWLVPFTPKDRRERWEGEMEETLGDLSSWIGSRYCFFLPESHWYPIPNSTFGHEYPERRPKNWATSRIAVEMPPGYTAVTQGSIADEQAEGKASRVVFESDVPVPQFSLCAGTYEKARTKIREIDCAFYYAPEHSENVEFFSDAAEDLEREIADSLERIGDGLHLSYPYGFLSLVEVPVQCRTFSDSWDGRNLLVQPGVLLIKETDFFNISFTQSYRRARRSTKAEGTGATDAQVKVELLKRYFERNVFGGDLEVNVLSNYWEFQIDPVGEGNGALGQAFTAAFSETALDRHQLGGRFAASLMMGGPNFNMRSEDGQTTASAGLSSRAREYLELDQKSRLIPLGELAPTEEEKKFNQLLDLKTEGLIRTLMMALGDKQWSEFIPGLREKYQFKQLSLDDLRREAETFSGEDLSWVFRQFISEPVVPGYAIKHAEAYEIDTGQREREFQAVVRVANLEEGRGSVLLEFETEGPADANTVEKPLFFDSYEEKEVRVVFRDKPKSVRLLPAHARNEEPPFETLYVPEETKDVAGEDSVRTVPATERELAIIVDDRDEGFSTVNTESRTYFRSAKGKEGKVEEDEEYPEYRGYGRLRRWHEQKIESAYGKYVRTRKLKTRGKGTQKAVWSASLPRDGMYEVFFYAYPLPSYLRGRYKMTVKNGDSSQDIDFNVATAKTGWNSLGKYRFESDGEARVELSDETEEMRRRSQRVYADAVKWVYQGA